MIFSDNLQALMEETKINTVQLAEILGVSDESISNWRKGKSVPKIDIAVQIARYFGVSLDELLGIPLATEREISLPLVGVISAGAFDILNEDQWDESLTVSADLLAGRPRNGCVSMKVSGNSMSPYLLEGDILVVHRQPYAVNGNIVVMYDPKLNGYTVKRFEQSGDTVKLIPYNAQYQTMIYNNPREQELNLYGVCVGLKRKLV